MNLRHKSLHRCEQWITYPVFRQGPLIEELIDWLINAYNPNVWKLTSFISDLFHIFLEKLLV